MVKELFPSPAVPYGVAPSEGQPELPYAILDDGGVIKIIKKKKNLADPGEWEVVVTDAVHLGNAQRIIRALRAVKTEELQGKGDHRL